MQGFKTSLTALAMAAALVACGGGGDDNQRLDRLVSVGDSLGDVGSYRTAGIAALGGGKYTVNGPDGKVWVERLAEQLGMPTLCAAQTGLEASGAFAALAGPVTNHAGCTAYGQGGSRVTNPVGPWNKALLASTDPSTAFTGQLGQLTVPLATQVATHLQATGGTFRNKDLVVVLGGANDVFVQSAALSALGAQVQAGQATPAQLQAATAQAAAAMAQAGTELATLVKQQIVAKGATHVLMLNLPNIALTPDATSTGTQGQAVATLLTQAFNTALAQGVNGVTAIKMGDIYTENTRQVQFPAEFGLTNSTTPVCTNTFPNAPGFLAPSLICTTQTVLAGDVSHYLFADGVHPTPYGHRLLADLGTRTMRAAGWID